MDREVLTLAEVSRMLCLDRKTVGRFDVGRRVAGTAEFARRGQNPVVEEIVSRLSHYCRPSPVQRLAAWCIPVDGSRDCAEEATKMIIFLATLKNFHSSFRGIFPRYLIAEKSAFIARWLLTEWTNSMAVCK